MSSAAETSSTTTPVPVPVPVPVLPPSSPPDSINKNNTLFIFDWDDTLLPTTWLALNDMRVDMPGPVPADIQRQCENYAPWALRTLEEAGKYGKIVIITNAEAGWIELTTQKFFPSWASAIEKIPYLSARSTWEPKGCVLPVEWKVRSFAQAIESFFEEQQNGGAGAGVGATAAAGTSATTQTTLAETADTAGGGGDSTTASSNTASTSSSSSGNNCCSTTGAGGESQQQIRNIIGLGDSTSDREAILHVTNVTTSKPAHQTIGKSLKFMERPSIDHLQKQHHLIMTSLKQIALHDKPLDLCIQHQPEQQQQTTCGTNTTMGSGTDGSSNTTAAAHANKGGA